MSNSNVIAGVSRWGAGSRRRRTLAQRFLSDDCFDLCATLGAGFLFMLIAAAATDANAGAGDLNNDGSINASDVLLMERFLKGETLPPPLDGYARVADLSPYDSANQLAMPDNSVDISDLLVLLARIAAGDQTIKQAPGPTTAIYDPLFYTGGNDPPPDPATNEYDQNPAFLSGTADAGATVELWVNGVFQQTTTADPSGVYSFAVFLNTHPGTGFDSFYTVSRNNDGLGATSQQFEVDYYDPDVRAACQSPNQDVETVLLPRSSPSSTTITVASGEYRVVTRGADPACTNIVRRVAESQINVNAGGTLVVMPGAFLELKGEFGQEKGITVSGGDFLAIGHAGDPATVRGDLEGWDRFKGISFGNGATGRFEYAEIVNAFPDGISIGNSTAVDTVSISISDSFVGFQDLTSPSNQIAPGEKWGVTGVRVYEGNSVDIVDSQLVGGGLGPHINPTYGLLFTAGGTNNVTLDGTVVANFTDGLNVSGVDAGDISTPPPSIHIVNESSIVSNDTGMNLSSGARLFVNGSNIRGNCTGVRASSSSPFIESSSIVENVLGLRVLGTSLNDPGVSQPLPTVNQSDLSGNDLTASQLALVSTTFAAPDCTATEPLKGTVRMEIVRNSGVGDLFDLSENYWGATDESAIFGLITEIYPDNSIAQDPDQHVPIDVSRYLAADLSIAGPAFVLSESALDLEAWRMGDVGNKFFNPTNPTGAEKGEFRFSSPVDLGLGDDRRARVRVYPERAYSAPGPSGPPANGIPVPIAEAVIGDIDGDGDPDGAVPKGVVAWAWDGVDTRSAPEGNLGFLMPDEAYVYELTIEATSDGRKVAEYRPVRKSSLGIVAGSQLDNVNLLTSGLQHISPVRIFEGEPLSVSVSVASNSANDPGANGEGARIDLYANASPDFGTVCGDDVSARRAAVHHSFAYAGTFQRFELPFRYTDDRFEDNFFPFIQNPDSHGRPQNDNENEFFCVGSTAWPNNPLHVAGEQILFDPHIVVRGVEPNVAGAFVGNGDVIQAAPDSTRPDTLRIRAEPYVVQYAYDQVVHFNFCLSQQAEVRFQILAPGVHSPTSNTSEVVATLVDTTMPGVAPLEARNCAVDDPSGMNFYHFVWDQISEPADALHTFVIEATSTRTDLLPTDQTVVYRGFLDLRP